MQGFGKGEVAIEKVVCTVVEVVIVSSVQVVGSPLSHKLVRKILPKLH